MAVKYCCKKMSGSYGDCNKSEYDALPNNERKVNMDGSACAGSTPNPSPGPGPGPGPGPAPGPGPSPKPCNYPSTNFTNKTESDKFRKFMHENFKSYATSIDLDLSGPKDNCNYIRKAYATVPEGYALSYGEIFKDSLTNNNWKDDLKTVNYNKYKEKQKETGIFTTDSQMWTSLIDEGKIPMGGEIKKLKGGTAYYILKADPSGMVVSMNGNETATISNLINPLKEGKFLYIAWAPPTDRNRKPLTGKVYDLKVFNDVNGKEYVGAEERKSVYWNEFAKKQTFVDELQENIIKDILSLITEDTDPPNTGVNINSYMTGNSTSGSNSTGINLNTMMTGGDKPTTPNKIEDKKTACISKQEDLHPDQKKSLDNFLEKNPQYTVSFSDTGTQDNIKLKDLRWSTRFGVNSDQGKLVIPQPPDFPQFTAVCDNVIVYKRSDIQGAKRDNISDLEDFINDAELNLTFDENALGTLGLKWEIGKLIPRSVLAQRNLTSFSRFPIYVEDLETLSKPTTDECRLSTKFLYNCLKNRRGGGILNCSDLKKIIQNKMKVYFCDKEVFGQGKLWNRIGLGKELEVLKTYEGPNDQFTITGLETVKESLSQTIKKTLSEAINKKRNGSLIKTIRKNLHQKLRNNG